MKIAVLLMLLPSFLYAQSNKAVLLDNYLRAAVTARAFNGTALVAQHGKVVYRGAFGYADYTSKAPLTDSSVFELASVTKPIVAYAILLLAGKGKLSLDDSLRKFIPELPYSGVKIRHMLTHVSGVPDAYRVMDEKWDKKKIATNADEIEFMIREKLPADFQPGTQTAYSNTAYELLAIIIERITQEPFDKCFYAGGERDLQVLFETGKGLQAGWFVFSGMKKRMMRIK